MDPRTQNEQLFADRAAVERLKMLDGWELGVVVKFTNAPIATVFQEKEDAEREYKALKAALNIYHDAGNFKDKAHEINCDGPDRRLVCLKDVADVFLNAPRDKD